MTRKDNLGLAVSGGGDDAVAAYAEALHQLQCYVGDPVGAADRALAASPDFVMAHALRAYLHLLSTEPGAAPVARAAYDTARKLTMNRRERGHVKAIGCLLDGEWHAAGRILEDVAIEYPRDALALQAGHLIDFFTGESRMLRDRIARALPAWSWDMPGHHAVLGMHAFGLEETGIYDRAEAAGRRAVEAEPRDGWAQHAVAHVMEMQGRAKDGIAWMRANPEAWSRESFFCVHNWWHLALYHLDLDEIEEVLALYDGPIYGKHSAIALDLIDASALLWRLHLRGVDVGDRWQPVADRWTAHVEGSTYAFNDAHAMMAFVGAKRAEGARAVMAAQERQLEGDGDVAMFAREVGAPVTCAIQSFEEGRYAEAVALLRGVRNRAYRFGGSHAQRDLIDLTLIEAALRDGQASLARALAAERMSAKPASPTGAALLRRADALKQARAA